MKRIEMITTKRSEIICYYDELDIIPETSFAQVSANSVLGLDYCTLLDHSSGHTLINGR